MSGELVELPEYSATMDRLEAAKYTGSDGVEYWRAREIQTILGYMGWRDFEGVLDRARDALTKNGIEPSHHFAPTHKMVELGSASLRQVVDYYLSRAACYLIAMNGVPSKPEIAAAQAYFAIQTRRMEVQDALSADEKRLSLREKVKQSHKLVSKAAQDAGVRSKMSLKDLKVVRNIGPTEQILDRAGPLELSANDFQMNLAANVIRKENIRGEQSAINRNKQVAAHVRQTIKQSGGTMPEDLPLEPPIKEIEKRVRGKKKLPSSASST
jgi:DNA-damage-inducible protein D